MSQESRRQQSGSQESETGEGRRTSVPVLFTLETSVLGSAAVAGEADSADSESQLPI